MNLPVRILGPGEGAPAHPVIAVDGAFGARGLELSHWPGHATPADLRHDLSTGCALRFADRTPAEREERAGGATEIVNNHYDTDGTCALFAVRHPARARKHATALTAAAASGDFFVVPNDAAFCVDVTIGAWSDAATPSAPGGDKQARWQLATEHWMEHLDALVDGDLGPYEELWAPALELLRADRAAVRRARREDHERLAASCWTAPGPFDPGRHALHAESTADRVLAIGQEAGGWTYRLAFSTRSWFSLVSAPKRPRPDLARLVRDLNERESSDPNGSVAWRAQAADSPAPELWYGGDGVALYAEHNGALRPSRLSPVEFLEAWSEVEPVRRDVAST